MNSRERFLVGILVAIVLVLGYMMMQPFNTLQRRIDVVRKDVDSKSEDLAREQREVERMEKRDPRLAHWRLLSLPESKSRTAEELTRHISKIQVDYEKYLYDLLRRNEFNSNSITITSKPPDSKKAPVVGGKGPAYTLLGFTVQAQASYKGVVQMLNDFHRTNLLHKVMKITVTKPATIRAGGNRTDLDVSMTIEALLVTGGERRDGLMPASSTLKPIVLAEPKRDYENLLIKNMFTGTVAPPGRLTEDKADVLRFIKLTMLYSKGRRWEASLYDQARGGEEKFLTTGVNNELSVRDRYGTEILAGRVLDINQRFVLFRADDKYYKMELGDFLGHVLEEPVQEVNLLLGGAANLPRKD